MNWLLLILAVIVLIFGLVVFRGSPYVPSQKRHIKRAFSELYPLNSDDLLVDIGSGDGIVLRMAAKVGAHAVGYEINPLLVIISRIICHKYRRIKIIFADFWLSNLPNKTTVVYVFSATRDMKRIIEKLQNETNKLGHPLNIISYGSGFDELSIVKNVGAYHLYTIYPIR